MDVGGASRGENPISHTPVGANGEADRDSPGIVQNQTNRDASVAPTVAISPRNAPPTGISSAQIALALNLCNLWGVLFALKPRPTHLTRFNQTQHHAVHPLAV
jgi:hypothetical protein